MSFSNALEWSFAIMWIYLFGALIAWDLNPANWNAFGRGALVIFLCFCVAGQYKRRGEKYDNK